MTPVNIILPNCYDETHIIWTDKQNIKRLIGTNQLVNVCASLEDSPTGKATIFFKMHGGIEQYNNASLFDGSCLDSIPKEWYFDINRDRMRIVVDTSNESWSPSYNGTYPEHEVVELHEILTHKLIDLGINHKALTWVTGDMNAEEHFADYSGVNIRSHCQAYFMSHGILWDTHTKDFSSNLSEETFENFSLCLMRDLRKEHRLYSIYKMRAENGLQGMVKTTSPKRHGDQTICDNYATLYHYYKEHNYQKPINWANMRNHLLDYYVYSPLEVPNDDIDEAQRRSLFALVSESFCFGDKNFITYSTFRAILSKRPFVIFGNKGVLKQLRAWGFETFDGILLDESYDDIDDGFARVDAAVVALKYNKVKNLPRLEAYERVQGIVEHNYNHFMKSQPTAADKYLELFKW